MSVEVQDFQQEVIEESYKTPVLVDFWAPWCGPCRVLGPILDRLAEKSNGKWKLAKVNTDVYPEISMQYGVRGIPAVKLCVAGEVVDEFTGALPENAVAQWLEKALPSENKRRIEQARLAMDGGEMELAERLLEQVLKEEPDNPLARVLLAQIVVFRDPERAESLVEGSSFAGSGFIQVEEAVKTIARLARLHREPEKLPDEKGKETYLEGINALVRHDYDRALDRFISLIQTNRYYDEDGARKASIALFTLLGEEHPTTLKHRRTFNMVLY